MSSYSEIDKCLISALIESLPERARVQYENAPIFETNNLLIWYQVFNLWNPADPVTLGEGGQDEVTGVFQVNIYTPLNTSTGETNQALTRLLHYFQIGSSFTFETTTVTITRSGKNGAGMVSDGKFKTIVSINWFSRIDRDQPLELVCL